MVLLQRCAPITSRGSASTGPPSTTGLACRAARSVDAFCFRAAILMLAQLRSQKIPISQPTRGLTRTLSQRHLLVLTFSSCLLQARQHVTTAITRCCRLVIHDQRE